MNRRSILTSLVASPLALFSKVNNVRVNSARENEQALDVTREQAITFVQRWGIRGAEANLVSISSKNALAWCVRAETRYGEWKTWLIAANREADIYVSSDCTTEAILRKCLIEQRQRTLQNEYDQQLNKPYHWQQDWNELNLTSEEIADGFCWGAYPTDSGPYGLQG